jgi:NADPH2:quinone reductase
VITTEGLSMRAVQVSAFADLEAIALNEVPVPDIAAAEVLIKVAAAPVNYVDLVTMRGEYQFKPQLPYTPGKGPAGTVEAVGSDVTGLKVGDRVLAMAEYGGYAEQCAVRAEHVYPLPDAMSFEEAASMSLAFDTAWMGLVERGRMSAGDRVLVLGATGAVGTAAVQLARALGARTVVAGVSSADRFVEAEAAGADSCVDLSAGNLRETVRERVLELTDGHGVDVVLDMLGGDAFDGAVRSVAWRGRLVIVGFASGRIPSMKMNYPLLKNIEVSGLQISDYRKRAPELVARCYREVFDLYTAGLLAPQPVRTYPLAEWRDAVTSLAARSHPGRLVLTP